MFVGIDIGGTKTAVHLTDAAFSLVAQSTHPTRGDSLVADLKQAVHNVLAAAHVTSEALLGLGIGIPGIVDPVQGVVSMAVNLQITDPLPLANQMKAEFLTPIVMENDVRLAAYGLHKKVGINDLAYLNIGTGISAGVILNGRLHRGVTGMAGEIGHVPITTTLQTLENLASGPAIIRQAETAGLQVQHAGELFLLASNSHKKAVQVIKQVNFYLSQAILWLMMSYDIEKVFIGGGVAKSGDLFLTPLLAELKQLRYGSHLAEQMVPDSKIALLPDAFNPGIWGALQMAATAADHIKPQNERR